MNRELTNPGAELYCATCEAVFASGELCPDDGTRLVRLAIPGDTLVGRELDGRYTIGEKLGQGGMGAVYRARQHAMGREVAIKVLSPGLVKDAASIKRFLREAKLASRLVHPNIVSVLDFGQTNDGLFYLVMELVAGRTLHDLILAEHALTPARIVRIGAQVCDALEGAHALPIIHRDLKPANIMILGTGRDLVKVLDFGLAKSLSPDTTSATMTSAGALLGTPTFMPPEVANGESVDHRADLYSLGCILFVMATGRAPFVSDSIPELIAAHGTMAAPRTTGVPRALGAVIDRLLEKDRRSRYQSAAELREALEQALETARDERAYTEPAFDHRRPVPPDRLTVESMPPIRSSEAIITKQFAAASPSRAEAPASLVSAPSSRRWPIVVLVLAIAVTLAAIAVVMRSSGPDASRVAAPMDGGADARAAVVSDAPALIASPVADASEVDASPALDPVNDAPIDASIAAPPIPAGGRPKDARRPTDSRPRLPPDAMTIEPPFVPPPDASPEQSPF